MIEPAGWEIRRQAGLRVPVFVYESDDLEADVAAIAPHFLLPVVRLDADDRPVFHLTAPDLDGAGGRDLGGIGPFEPAQQTALEQAQRSLRSCLVIVNDREGAGFVPRDHTRGLVLDFSGQLARAEVLAARTRHAEAVDALEPLLERDPVPFGVHTQLGRCRLAHGDLEAGLEHLAQELAACTTATGDVLPAASVPLALMAELQAEAGAVDDALATFGQVFALRPNFVDALLAAAMHLAGRAPATARALLGRAFACRPGGPEVRDVAEALGLGDEAVAGAAAAVDPRRPLDLEVLLAGEDAGAGDGAAPAATGPGPTAPGAPAAADEALDAEAAARIYRVLCHLSAVDGEVDPRERVCLDAFRDLHRIGAERAATLEAEGLRGEGLAVGPSARERTLLIRAMVDVAAADGRLDPAELERLREVAQVIGLPPLQLARYVEEVFSSLGSGTGRVTEPAGGRRAAPAAAAGRTIATAAGDLELRPAPPAVIERVRTRWPLGLDERAEGVELGFVMSRAGEAAAGLLLRQTALDHELAAGCAVVDRMRIAFGAGAYAELGFEGLLLAGAVLRHVPGGFEPGIAFFPVPAAGGPEASVAPAGPDFVDRHLGRGSSAMVSALLAGIGRGADEAGLLPLAPATGLAIVTRDDLPMLWLEVLLVGGDVVCLAPEVDPRSKVWEGLVLGGVRKAYHLPCVPVALV